MDADLAASAPPARSDALARATALANRARGLRKAQVEVQDLTAHEVQVMARTAASFFEAIPLPEFTAALLPLSARQLRRMRHRILHRTVHTTHSGTMIHALLLGRDGELRLFSVRTADSRDLLLSLEPGRSLPPSVIRDIVEWTPMLRVSGFRPFEVLEKLSGALDAVEAQIAEAEEKVLVQKQALASGDLTALLPGRSEGRPRAALSPGAIDVHDARVETPDEGDLLEVYTPTSVVAQSPTPASLDAVPTPPSVRAPTPTSMPTSMPFDIFDVVEQVAATVDHRAPRSTTASSTPIPPAPSVASRYALDDEPEEWDEPVVPAPPPVSRSSLFPVLPPPR